MYGNPPKSREAQQVKTALSAILLAEAGRILDGVDRMYYSKGAPKSAALLFAEIRSNRILNSDIKYLNARWFTLHALHKVVDSPDLEQRVEEIDTKFNRVMVTLTGKDAEKVKSPDESNLDISTLDAANRSIDLGIDHALVAEGIPASERPVIKARLSRIYAITLPKEQVPASEPPRSPQANLPGSGTGTPKTPLIIPPTLGPLQPPAKGELPLRPAVPANGVGSGSGDALETRLVPAAQLETLLGTKILSGSVNVYFAGDDAAVRKAAMGMDITLQRKYADRAREAPHTAIVIKPAPSGGILVGALPLARVIEKPGTTEMILMPPDQVLPSGSAQDRNDPASDQQGSSNLETEVPDGDIESDSHGSGLQGAQLTPASVLGSKLRKYNNVYFEGDKKAATKITKTMHFWQSGAFAEKAEALPKGRILVIGFNTEGKLDSESILEIEVVKTQDGDFYRRSAAGAIKVEAPAGKPDTQPSKSDTAPAGEPLGTSIGVNEPQIPEENSSGHAEDWLEEEHNSGVVQDVSLNATGFYERGFKVYVPTENFDYAVSVLGDLTREEKERLFKEAETKDPSKEVLVVSQDGPDGPAKGRWVSKEAVGKASGASPSFEHLIEELDRLTSPPAEPPKASNPPAPSSH